MKPYWFHITLLLLIVLPIALLYTFDYLNVEGYNHRWDPETNTFQDWSNNFFNSSFTFDVTWKGRMFYLFFAWFLVMEAAFGWQEMNKRKTKNHVLLGASLACAAIPTGYILATNFLGLDLSLLQSGISAGIPAVYSDNTPSDFLHLFWPLSIEYLVFLASFTAAVLLAYKPKGIRTFAVSLTLLGGIGIAYMLDTVFPFGVLKPLQEIALPITATTAALFDLLGYNVMFSFPVNSGGSMLPALMVNNGVTAATVTVSWACAGVYSILLYVLVMLVFFKRTNISSFRKLVYFIVGLIGTFFAAVLRIFAIILVYLYNGKAAGVTFHNTYGELFGFTWIFGFILLIVLIERFSLVERTQSSVAKLGSKFRFVQESREEEPA
jgi:thaumarchaeosortase